MTTTREHRADAPAPPEFRRSRTRAPSWVDAAAGPALVALLSLAAAAQALRLWDWRPGIPLSLSGDAPQVLAQIRSIMDSSWLGTNHHLGAPFGMNQGWYTTADSLNFGVIKVIGLLGWSPATTGALFFLATFPTAALAAYWLGRQLAMSRPAAVTVGVLFSLLPGHQVWFGHLWLAAYWVLPLAAWLIIRVARAQAIWPTLSAMKVSGAAGRSARWQAARTMLVVAAIGLSDVYYVAFTLILLMIVLVLRLGTGTRPRGLLPGFGVIVGIGGLCAGSLAVTTRSRSGDLVTGELPAQRLIGESETYAGKLIELLLPWYQHRVAPLRFLSYAYGVAAQPSVERPALGMVALLGVVALLWTVVTSLTAGRRLDPLWGLLAALTLVALAFYTRGGLGSVFALFVTPMIRTWSRFVVFIGLFGLVAVGLWLTSLGRRRGRRALVVAATVVLVVGVLDQTSPTAAPQYAALQAQQTELTAYTRTLARAVGNCPVFQLPVVAFPEEPPPGAMDDYDHFLPTVTSPAGLTWSYAAIRGTARADWQFALPVGDQARLLDDLAAAGFCAVEIDHQGYAGSTDPGPVTERLAGPPVATAPRSHLATYDLRPVAARLAATAGSAAVTTLREEVLHPLFASMGGSLIDATKADPFQWTGPQTTVTVSNLGASTVTATLTFTVWGNGAAPRTVTVRSPGVPDSVVTVSDSRPYPVSLQVAARPGTTAVTLSATGDPVPVAGSQGAMLASLKVADLRLAADSEAPAASLQQFASASPRSLR